MAPLVVTWVLQRLLVTDLVLGSFWIISDLIFLQDLILSSSFTMQTSTACSPFGQRSTLEYGSRPVRPYKGDPSPSLQVPRWTTRLVRRLNFGRCISTLTRILGLTPFWNSQTGFWASSEIATTSGLSYTYPEFNGLNLGNSEAVSTAIATYVTRQYGAGQITTAGPVVSFFAQPFAAKGAPAPAAHSAPAAHDAPVAHGAAPASEDPDVIYDWAARIHAKKFELGHGYAVLIFLGDVPDDPEHWRTSPSFVGAHVAFVSSQTDQCANCNDQAELVIEGFVHLNEVIAERSGLSSFEPSVVAPYLKDNLHWRVQAVRSSFCLVRSF